MRLESRRLSCELLVLLSAGAAVKGFHVHVVPPRGAARPSSATTRTTHPTSLLATTGEGSSSDSSSSSELVSDGIPPAAFGQVVRRKPYNTTLHGTSGSLGDSAAASDLLFSSTVVSPASASSAAEPTLPSLESIRRRNVVTAVAAVVLALANYAWQFTHPQNPLQLLAQMQASSSDLSVIGTNGRPTLVDFWAPFCENCKIEAATLEQVHQKYAGRVNFVMVNGDDPSPRSWEAIDAFGVDVVPHMALVNADGEVETALIGIIPQHVIEADLDTILGEDVANSGPEATTTTTASAAAAAAAATARSPLPYTMLDTFASRPEQRKLHFDPTTTRD